MKKSCAWLVFVIPGLAAVALGCEPRACTAPRAAPPYARAETFCVPWDVVTAIALSTEAVRQSTPTVLRENKDIAALLEALNLGELHPPVATTDTRGDFRLVVDLIRPDGMKDSFAAERGRLVRLSDGASHAIDEGFRARFLCKK